ncbi:amino acid permease [Janthinobacterium lividum]|uniref:amino acid permease n=1 Tax=Janthinobacterium lividum TaxID=29581 RepID=UPI00140D11F4|nr:amino acid permease [Janthinobacterium lividum]NHQ94326.1 amino acid permease [Janthinobacterium lividum]
MISESHNSTGLQHSLKQRHMSMIAIGGVIGAGLFVGSGVIAKAAGPAAILSFLLTGGLVVLIMRMLGELASSLPVVGSFYEYARLAFDDKPKVAKFLGFMSGWMYWYFWVVVVALEAIAGAKLVNFWLPDVPSWSISLVLLVSMTILNLFSVKAFGEFEFWFASIKVVAIIVFLFVGALFITGSLPNSIPTLGFLTSHGGFMPHGWGPVLSGAVAATAFYSGAEIVTIAAAETSDPAKAIARATNSVITRVLMFYVGSMFVVVCIVPWDTPAIATPFVSALTVMNIPYAAHIMNAIILTAVLSALNSSLYASSRMIFALTRRGDAPTGLVKLSKNGVPIRAILFSTLFAYFAIAVSYVSADLVFPFIVNSYGILILFVYLLIAISQLRLRRRLERECPERIKVRMWLFPYLTYFTIIAMLVILGAMSVSSDTEQRVSFWFGLLSVVIMSVMYYIKKLVNDDRNGDNEAKVELKHV